MKRYGLIGYPLGHSFSERYFAEKFGREGIRDCAYTAYPIADISFLPALLVDHTDLCGLNVTIPYKEAVIPYLTHIDAQAREVGAVNCIRIRQGALEGFNTDVYGFRASLLELIGPARPGALILGSGGASKAVAYVLRQLGMDYRTVSRSAQKGALTYADLDAGMMDAFRLIVNTTPLGTYPDTDACPDIPYEFLSAGHYLYDVVYNPPVTRFLALGAQQGAKVMNGAQMLVLQAEKSWEIWNE